MLDPPGRPSRAGAGGRVGAPRFDCAITRLIHCEKGVSRCDPRMAEGVYCMLHLHPVRRPIASVSRPCAPSHTETRCHTGSSVSDSAPPRGVESGNSGENVQCTSVQDGGSVRGLGGCGILGWFNTLWLRTAADRSRNPVRSALLCSVSRGDMQRTLYAAGTPENTSRHCDTATPANGRGMFWTHV